MSSEYGITDKSMAVTIVKGRCEYIKAFRQSVDTDGNGAIDDNEAAAALANMLTGASGVDPAIERFFFIRQMNECSADHEVGLSLRGVEFGNHYEQLLYADFSQADLERATFCYTDLRESDFSGANLGHAKFVSARLEGALWTNASLQKTDFTNSRNEPLSFSAFKGAKFWICGDQYWTFPDKPKQLVALDICLFKEDAPLYYFANMHPTHPICN